MPALTFKQGTTVGATPLVIHTVTASKNGIFDINLSATVDESLVDLYIDNGGTITYLEKDLVLPLGTPLVRTKEMIPEGAIISVLSDIDGVSVTLSGIEEVY